VKFLFRYFFTTSLIFVGFGSAPADAVAAAGGCAVGFSSPSKALLSTGTPSSASFKEKFPASKVMLLPLLFLIGAKSGFILEGYRSANGASSILAPLEKRKKTERVRIETLCSKQAASATSNHGGIYNLKIVVAFLLA
jgi:hypothetical protein